MNHEQVAFRVAELLASEPPGTKVTVWTDGAVTRTCSVLNPTVVPGANSRPVAFFVAGIDRPVVDDVAVRVQRAVGSTGLRSAS